VSATGVTASPAVIGVLLVGGASARFPGGKLEATIPDTLATRYGRPELAGVTIADATQRALTEAVGAPLLLGTLIPDQQPHQGPSTALHDLIVGPLLVACPDTTRIVVVAGDAPFTPPHLIGVMAAAAGSVIVAASEPLPFAADLGALRKAATNGVLPRMRDLATALSARALDPRLVTRLDPLGGALADIDTPADLAR